MQLIKYNLNGGEISPFSLGRVDLEKYPTCEEQLWNWIPLLQGGVTKRQGFRYICPAMGPSRLIRYVFSLSQAYVLEFGNQVMRFYTNDGQIQTSPGVPYQIGTPYNTAVDNLWDLKHAQVGTTMYFVHPNHPPMKLSRLNDTDWTLIQPNFYGPPMNNFENDFSGGTISISLTGTGPGSITAVASAPFFIQSDLGEFVVAGTGSGYITAIGGTAGTDPATGADTYTNASINVVDQYDTTSYGPGNWFLRGSPQSYIADGEVTGGNWGSTHKLGVGGQTDIWAFAKYPINGHAPPPFQDTFRSQMNGGFITLDGAVLQINAVVSSNHLICTRVSPYTVLTATADGVQVPDAASGGEWTYEQYSFTVAHGYPRAVAFFQDRLWFASTTSQPQTIWGSISDDFENFAKGTADDAALDFSLANGQFDQILWMAPFQGNLICGTFSGEYVVNGGSGQLISTGVGAAVTPTNVSALLQSSYGSTPIQPLIIQNDLIYIQRSRQTVYQFTFNIYQSIFASRNLTLMNNSITTSGFKEMVYVQSPFFLICFIDLAGNLVSLTYEKTDQVEGWSRWFTGTDTGDQFVSVASIPVIHGSSALNSYGGNSYDEMWACIQRNVNGQVVYSIELWGNGQLPGNQSSYDLYLDYASHFVASAPITSISGLTYLIGRPIYIIADQQVLGPITPTGDTYTFPPGIVPIDVQVGINYAATGLTVRPEIGQNGQTIQSLLGSWSRIFARMYYTVPVRINGMLIPAEQPMTPANISPGYQSGDFNVPNLGHDRNKRISFISGIPGPSTLIALFGKFDVGAI